MKQYSLPCEHQSIHSLCVVSGVGSVDFLDFIFFCFCDGQLEDHQAQAALLVVLHCAQCKHTTRPGLQGKEKENKYSDSNI